MAAADDDGHDDDEEEDSDVLKMGMKLRALSKAGNLVKSRRTQDWTASLLQPSDVNSAQKQSG
jgi:hypothetical protein